MLEALSKDLRLCQENVVVPVLNAIAAVDRMLNALIRSLGKKRGSAPVENS